jgi:hypothetical protein
VVRRSLGHEKGSHDRPIGVRHETLGVPFIMVVIGADMPLLRSL